MKVDSRRTTDLQNRDLGHRGASKTAAKRPLRPHEPLSTIPTPRAGFDRLLFSVSRVYVDPSSLPKLPLPKSLGPFRRRGDNALPVKSSPTYRRRAAYSTADETIFMDILHQPRHTPRPLFQVQFRASMRHLIDLRLAEEAIKELPNSILRLLDRDAAKVIRRSLLPLRFTLSDGFTLSEVELTLDFPAGEELFRKLRQSLLTPWSRQHYAFHVDDASGGRQSRRSQTNFRLYKKDEDGIMVNRVEWVIRRGQLRRWGVSTIANLYGMPWTSRVLKRLLFVDFHPSGRKNDRLEYLYGDVVRVAGAAYALQKCSLKDRQQLRRYFRPNDLHAQAEAALRAFEAKLVLAKRKSTERWIQSKI